MGMKSKMTANMDDKGTKLFDIKILSLNVRGLRNESKRKSVYNYIRKKQIDVCFLQESHALDQDKNIWENQWGGKMYFSNGSSKARGVIILLKRDMNCSIEKVTMDTDGRMVHLLLKLDDVLFNFYNIYAPNIVSLQKEFYCNLIRYFDQATDLGKDNIIIGGGL